jgi:hypothetical protein
VPATLATQYHEKENPMSNKPWLVALGLCVLQAVPVHAEVIKGLMTVSQCD